MNLNEKRVEMCREKENTDFISFLFRLLASGYIRLNTHLFEGYLDPGNTIENFCATEVEPLEKECDQVFLTSAVIYFNSKKQQKS